MHSQRPPRSPCTPGDQGGCHACPATKLLTLARPTCHSWEIPARRPSFNPLLPHACVASIERDMQKYHMAMQGDKVTGRAWRPPWSPGMHGDLGGRWECMVTYGTSPRRDALVTGCAVPSFINFMISLFPFQCWIHIPISKVTHTSLNACDYAPRSMLVSQAIGTAIGFVVAPLTFFLFYMAFDVGNPDGEYKAPYALIYRNMAILATNLLRDFNPKHIGKFVPLPMVMAVPFLVGAYFAIDVCVGSLVVFAWHRLNGKKAGLMVPAVASGLICGNGLWLLPSSILALLKVRPPICMNFFASP
ncbi:Metal-nicotianamine transporter YSL2 [Hibiscus syriacus]|uniref:Metal-nicotianamine transporter YSL2 n=1 Tax=Hibiscus syriacus TaxID=106335 RepID=A0A6A3BST5_HIBSY|nr:Metal-nicotianamine transporter YSL2 [Hibiscus syriacus]